MQRSMSSAESTTLSNNMRFTSSPNAAWTCSKTLSPCSSLPAAGKSSITLEPNSTEPSSPRWLKDASSSTSFKRPGDNSKRDPNSSCIVSKTCLANAGQTTSINVHGYMSNPKEYNASTIRFKPTPCSAADRTSAKNRSSSLLTTQPGASATTTGVLRKP